jgi:hypothetical protein
MLRATISATLLLPTATLLGAGCGQSDAAATQGLGASLVAAPKAAAPKAAAPKAAAPKAAAPKAAAPKIDMSYIFKGTDADRQKLELAGFKPGMTKDEKLALVKGISGVLERMQADDARDPSVKLPRAVRDGAATWNNLRDIEKLELLEANPAPNPGGPVSNWAAAAVGIAVAGLAYQVAKDEKWINDKELKELQIRTFSVEQLDHVATLGNSPLMLPAKQVANTH